MPGTARAILQAVMRAAQSTDAARGIVAMIGRLQPHEEDDTDDSGFIDSMMEELGDETPMGRVKMGDGQYAWRFRSAAISEGKKAVEEAAGNGARIYKRIASPHHL